MYAHLSESVIMTARLASSTYPSIVASAQRAWHIRWRAPTGILQTATGSQPKFSAAAATATAAANASSASLKNSLSLLSSQQSSEVFAAQMPDGTAQLHQQLREQFSPTVCAQPLQIAPKQTTERLTRQVYVTSRGNVRRWSGTQWTPVCLCPERKYPSYGLPENPRPTCCVKCKSDQMVYTQIRNRCLCAKSRPSFGRRDDSKPTCCYKCKSEDMVDIVNRRCRGGEARPIYGVLGDSRPTCCSKCKSKDMVDIANPRCQCGQHNPSLGFPGAAVASCCAKCKALGMVNIIDPRCPVCGKIASFPDAAGNPRRFCARHSSELGAHLLSPPTASVVASRCFDLIEQGIGCIIPNRIRFNPKTSGWSGEEIHGLIPDRRFRPDGYNAEKREAWEFLGNYYHGYPPSHHRH
ncbi:unnamed protein product [Polarella glacialis]|uniref:Uncharacterized protein n=1 Tax=Polarella glacialis TaxID=89957 RepID=A0A813J1A6_POLGL|nr:unnamed protein product [Polarella glacialis]